MLLFRKLSEHAYEPSYGSEKSAGVDLRSAYDFVVPAHGKEQIKTDLSIRSGTYGRVASRSGLAWKHFIEVGAGVIDEDYHDEIFVILINHSDKDFVVKKGDRIAQLICECIIRPKLIETNNASFDI